jgi:hypothetical protein
MKNIIKSMDILELMTNLSVEMTSVANAMADHADTKKCKNKDEWISHSKELINASKMMAEWAVCVEDEDL